MLSWEVVDSACGGGEFCADVEVGCLKLEGGLLTLYTYISANYSFKNCIAVFAFQAIPTGIRE